MRKTNLGLTQLDPGDSLALDGYSFQSQNPLITDRLLRVGAKTHRHDNHAAVTTPTDAVTGALTGTGNFAASTTYVFGYTLVDTDGGETTISPTVTLTTPAPMGAPAMTPDYLVNSTGGHVVPGTYYYAVTLSSGNGETILGPVLEVQIDPGTDTNQVLLSGLGDIVNSTPGATGWRMYKASTTGRFHFLAAGPAALDSLEDDGLICADCNTLPPAQNTSVSPQGVSVLVPATVTNAQTGVVGFRLYGAVSGDFTSPSFIAQYATTQFGQPVVLTAFDPQAGAPPDASTSLGGAAKIDPDTELVDWHWKRPVANQAALPSNAEAGDVRVAQDSGKLFSYDGTTWSPMDAAVAYWQSPVATYADLPSTGNALGDARIVLDTADLFIWTGASWEQITNVGGGGGGTGGGHVIYDGTTAKTQRSKLTFVGSGVGVADDAANDRTIINIPGATSSPSTPLIIADASGSFTHRDKLKFTGDGVSVSDDSAGSETIINIPGSTSGGGGGTGAGNPLYGDALLDDTFDSSSSLGSYTIYKDPSDSGTFTVTGGGLKMSATGDRFIEVTSPSNVADGMIWAQLTWGTQSDAGSQMFDLYVRAGVGHNATLENPDDYLMCRLHNGNFHLYARSAGGSDNLLTYQSVSGLSIQSGAPNNRLWVGLGVWGKTLLATVAQRHPAMLAAFPADTSNMLTLSRALEPPYVTMSGRFGMRFIESVAAEIRVERLIVTKL